MNIEDKTSLTRSDIEKMVKPLQWNRIGDGYQAELNYYTFFDVNFHSRDKWHLFFRWGHVKNGFDTLEEAQQYAQKWLVDFVCSALRIEE